MARRALIAVLVVALGVLAAAWYASATFTISRSVMVTPHTLLTDTTPRAPESREMRIECSPNSSYYVTDSGNILFFNGTTGSPEDPHPLCDDARSQRRVTAVLFVLVGLLGAAAVIISGRVRARRAAKLAAPSVDVGSQRGTAT